MTKSAKKKVDPAPSGPEFVDCEQGSPEWFEARRGLPTASMFSVIMANGRDGDASLTRTRYLNRLAGELVTETLAESYNNRFMERGKEMEPQAVAHYERVTGRTVKRVGFARNFSGLKRCGASADGLIGFDGGLETKTMMPELMIPLLEKGARMLPEHLAQVQGNLWVYEREWWDLSVFYPKMPKFIVRCERNETFIRNLSAEVERFNYELKMLVERLRNMGGGE